jgi:ABC-2 type transport system permease protein
MTHAGAIIWAQWRTLWHSNPRRGFAWSAAVSIIWYGIWAGAAYALLRVFSNPAEVPVIRIALPGGLLLIFLYWQVVPLMLATTGSSLDLRKLRAYPIPDGQLFSIEVLLRVTSGIEMVLVLLGITIGAMLNPILAKWSLLATLIYVAFNLVIAVGLRDVLGRLLARKRIRELVFFLVILAVALPQLLLARQGMISPQLRLLVTRDAWQGWPWTATSNLILGNRFWASLAVLSAWTVGTLVFSRWQFSRTLAFDSDAANARDSGASRRSWWIEWFYQLPSAVFKDPLGALIEKEFRFLVRSPRFRLVFLMGFTFGLVIWLPMVFVPRGPLGGFFVRNYLTVVCVYSLMLMSEVCFWNAFGFDRSAAQFYFLAPVSFRKVMAGKNLTALFFMLLEIAMVTLVCALLRMPLGLRRFAEAYSVAAVVMIFLFSAGNLLSIRQAKGVDPGNSIRTGAAGRLQALLFAIYPVTFAPILLAYLARYAFGSQAALYAILGLDAVVGIVVYRLALDSAVRTADLTRESMIAALSTGDGPIAS